MKNFKIFLRSFYITSVITICLIIAVLGSAKAYENIRRIGFGEYRNAVEIKGGNFKFFDMEFEFNFH